MCGGGQSGAQKEATRAQTDISRELAGLFRERSGLQTPFLSKRVKGGLPFRGALMDFSGGTQARSFAPAKGALERRLAGFGGSLPSGFREQARSDFESGRARAFDDTMVRNLLLDEETRFRAADALNPLGFSSGAQQGFGSILSIPGQPSPASSILGGALAGLAGFL